MRTGLVYLFSLLIVISLCGVEACHDDNQDEVDPTPSVTPTPLNETCEDCHATPPSTGKHLKHNSSYCCPCAACHATSVDTANELLDGHDNGSVDVVFAGGGTWMNGGCFGLSSQCHGDRLW